MSKVIRIALDAMGGDHAPDAIVAGAALALERKPDSFFVFFGRSADVDPLLDRYPALKAASERIHADDIVRMEDKPSQALRSGRRSSMWMAVDAVKTGTADIAVSAGNTGALMAMSTINLRTMAGVARPAIAGLWPTLRGESVVLDMGATIGADARQLVDFAVMGSAMARIVFDLECPTVGLLNVGVEEMKGVEEVKAAAQILREGGSLGLEYKGFVEGDDIGKGTVDVVVTEGFSGNIALKTAEGTARQISHFLRSALSRTWRTKLGYLLAKPAFDALREKLDPRNSNGGVFLGLNGIVIKSHGGSDAEAFAAAIELGHDMARYELLTRISAGLADYDRTREANPASAGGAALS
ncbi:phosphate acyltransferase PlsX [Terrihabitans sp. B22-R8]|uniref:phosphate acyltransferase PlsX n=1 Tax=Terrihabitans sp. B22-R8 TaxID=3425128 RepID=UPI00403D4B07